MVHGWTAGWLMKLFFSTISQSLTILLSPTTKNIDWILLSTLADFLASHVLGGLPFKETPSLLCISMLRYRVCNARQRDFEDTTIAHILVNTKRNQSCRIYSQFADTSTINLENVFHRRATRMNKRRSLELILINR
ncbi:hypothetical protein BD289DRAFT_245513 [Coniella lustricola]|uniref:Secreted protein n=1 Tax=Coniella lustricola TaxID=2025994 RepID=A0A2T3A966_9PEZI|nr:hypothetical protein BD289DRAFT_245513 [Coniella lustricola]